jgi:hypothetical protein
MLALATGCQVDRIKELKGQFKLNPESIDMGAHVIGTKSSAALTLENSSRFSVNFVVSSSNNSFVPKTDSNLSVTGTSSISIEFIPTQLGPVSADITIDIEGIQYVSKISGEGVPVPNCPNVNQCVKSVFSLTTESCVETLVADGTACSDVCLTDSFCKAGACVGTQKTCDDSNACTVDSCASQVGCQHSPKVCESQNACEISTCNVLTGCESIAAEDGTSCGALRGCTQAQVCISGACVIRDPPEGFVCAEASPCQGEGICRSDVCVQPAQTILKPSWMVGQALIDGGVPPGESWSDFTMSANGDMALHSYFFSPPRLKANNVNFINLPSSARRCIEWNSFLICGDYPGTAEVSAVELSTGKTRWTYKSVTRDLPQFAGPSVDVFTARIFAQSQAELGVLFESRSIDESGAATRCRHFGIVILNALGERVRSAHIENPIFEVCNHPHPYSLAVDTTGDIYIAFSPSRNDNPATWLNESSVFALRRDLTQKWTRGEGEFLGDLLPTSFQLCHGRNSFDSASGTINSVSGPCSAPTHLRSLQATIGLMAVGVYINSSRKMFPFPVPVRLESYVATLATKGKTEILLVSDREGILSGFDLHSDTERLTRLFECHVESPGPALMMSGAQGKWGFMSKPTFNPVPNCSDCDPQFAQTQNIFWTLDLPLLSPSTSPWPERFGSSTHDHRSK